MTPTILITRPRDDAHILADVLRSNAPKATYIIAPVMEIVPLDPVIEPDIYTGVVLTSRYAVPFAAQSFRDVTAYCVGDATAAAANAAGLDTMSARGSADDLVALLMREHIAPLAHLHGVHTVGDIAARLTQAGLPTRSFAVYAQKEVDWTPEAQAQIVAAQSLIVPVYSPRTAALAGARLAGLGANITLVAISTAALEAWTGPQPLKTVIAKRPDGDSMRLAIASQFA
ncbi:uroporphyrinogen-III synthase [Celeribacter sp.]|uniref:uroporphyrinogen-III synthase n=1 Tax=Celeribacter sp. TaxID=1890673 RepID=UPI003A8DA913